MAELHETVGVYVHIPFCERVCPYCDFAVVAARSIGEDVERRYVDAVLRELDQAAPAFEGRALASLYLGGGTPSLFRPAALERIRAAVERRFEAVASPEGVEITLEVNPSTVERERLPGFREAGINRLSVGIQSFDDAVLHRLGRAHRAEENHRSWRAAREAGFENLSLDLIFGAPGGSAQQLERDLELAREARPEHVSIYQLTVEPQTPFDLAQRRGQLALPSEEESVEALERIVAALDGAGLPRYEVSNFARPGFESRHNQRYWSREPVLGLGVGAVTNEPASEEAPFGLRRSNRREWKGYLEGVEAGRGAAAEVEVLDAPMARGETVFLGLRRARGLSARSFAAIFGASPRHYFGPEIEELLAAGLLDETPAGDLSLTARGWLLADSVAERFV